MKYREVRAVVVIIVETILSDPRLTIVNYELRSRSQEPGWGSGDFFAQDMGENMLLKLS